MKKALLVMAIAMAAIFARAQLLTPWKAPVECDIPTVTKLYGTQMSAKAVASTASQRSIKAITPTASQTWWGYFSESNASSLNFSGNLGYGSAVTLNAAIMVEGSNSFVKGSTIKAVRFWLADDLSAISSDLTLWVSKSLPASASAADYTQTIPKANISSRLNEVELTTPYDATSMQSGDKLYIGFSFSISGRAYPIMAGGTDMSGGFYYNTGSSWIDFVGEGYKNGNLALQLLLDGGTYPTNCASIDNIGQEVVKSGSSVSIPCKITNKGIDDITSLEFTIKDANGSTQTVTRTLSNSLALNNSTSISLSFDAASTPQKSDISVTVTKVNGVDNTLSASDGLKVGTGTLITVSSAPTVVPVVEEFTGTWCGYCPYGTVAMQKAHQQYGDEIVQIAIHSGDPMAVSDYSPVISAYCDGYPNATIDRQSTFHAANIPYRLTSAFNRVSQGMIELTAEWSDAGKTVVKFNTKSTFGYSDNNGQYGIALVLTEDGMTGTSSYWSQNNYLSGGSGNSDMQFWYDSPSTVSGLEYDHVAVAVWNALNGADGSIPSSFTADTPIEYNFTGDISSNTLIQDKTKLKAVALLIDRVSGKIVNAAQCSLNGDDTPTPSAYAALSEDNTVLTFYYDTNKESRNGMNVGPFSYKYVNGENIVTGRGWNDYVSSITKVVFDASFAEYRPTSTAYWFYKCEILANITGIENLKTDEVTDMSNMFDKCSGLTSLDVSNFNTENVKGMSSMFRGCSGLTSVNVSNFNTSNVTDMYGMFFDCSKLTSLDVSNFNTDNVASMHGMFEGCSSLTSLDVSNFNTGNVTDMGLMFWGCSGLISLDVSKFNTSNVTDMSDMFWGCSGLTSLDVSKFNTDKVTSMISMFWGCSGLTSLDVSNFNTDNVTSMYGMFEGCSSLTSLDVSNFNTGNVTDMRYMFWGCSGLTSLDVSKFNTDKVTSMGIMFGGCSGLTSLDASKFNTSNVTDMSDMFSGCSSLTNLDVSNFNTDNVASMHGMFEGCSSLTSLDVSNFNTGNVTDMGLMFCSCSNLPSLDVSNFNTEKVTSMSSMFYGCSGLTSLDISNFNTDNVASMYGMFWRCSSLTTIKINADNWNTSNVTNSNRMFVGCTKLVGGAGTTYDSNHTDVAYAHIDEGPSNPGYLTDVNAIPFVTPEAYAALSEDNTVLTFYYDANKANRNGMSVGPFTLSFVDGVYKLTGREWNDYVSTITKVVFDATFADYMPTSTAYWFSDCNALTTIAGIENLKTDNVASMEYMFDGCSGLISLDVSKFNTSNVTNMSSMFGDCSGLTNLDVSNFNTSKVEYMGFMFDSCSGLISLDVSNFNTSNVKYMSFMFYRCSGLTSLDVSNFYTEKVTSMASMFSGCSSLTNLDVSNFNTSKVTRMDGMFSDCSGLTSLDVSNFNTEKVTIMNCMFDGCSSLTNLDLSNFNTGNVTSMNGMFCDCSNLTTIKINADNWNTSNVTKSELMFYRCTKLVGGAGTTFDSNHTDVAYAHIDGGPSNPGYLTDKNSTAPTSGNITFADANVKALCVTKWDTNGDGELSKDEAAAVTDLGETFKRNTKIKSFDELQYFTGLTSIGDYAFDNCGLTSITIPNSVTTIGEWAFYNCYSLTSIVISNHVTSIGDYAFSFCSSLTSFTIPNSVTSIGVSAFGACSGLTSVTIGNSVTSIKNWTFHGCKGLTSIEIPNSVTSIGESAFSFCSSLTSVSIPNSVTSIGLAAFQHCTGLTSINIPSSVTKIGTYAFSSCSSLTSVTVDPGNPIYDSRNGCNAIIRTADNTLVVGCPTTTIPSSVTTIGEQAFSFCSGLTSITIPNSVTSIESLAFYHCTGLTSIEIPNSVTSIGDSAFDGCTGLTSIEIPNSVTSIGETAFFDCSGLTEFHSLIETPFDINENTFWSNNEAEFSYDETKLYETIKLYVPAGTAEAYKATDGWKNFKSIIEVVDERAITITAENKTMVYGEALPEFTFKSEGGNLTGKPVISCEATATSPAGTYPIIVAKGTLANPNVTYVAGTLTITKAPLTIRAGSYTRKQGEKNPEFALSYEGFKNGETESVLSKQPVVTCEATATSEPGEYAIAVSGAEANNYEISYVAGKLTVTEADQIILTANSYTRKYGEENPQFGYVVDGTELSGTPAVTCEATAASPAGTYPITINKGTVTNPNVTYVAGKLTITKAPLTISVGDYNKVEGEDNPEFALSYDGFKNNDTEAVLKKQPVITTEATKDSKAGEYAITVSGAEAENYDITYVTGKLTVTAKPLPEITPIESETTVSTEGLSEADLSDNVVNDVYYNVGEQGYDAAEKSIVISEATNMAQITDKEPGSKDVRDGFNGIIMKVGKGFGLITVSAKTSGNAQLVVQVGNQTPMLASKTEKGDVVFRYDVEEDTYVYIYAIIGSSAAKGYGLSAADTESSVRIYSITVSPGATGIRSIGASGKNDGIIYDLQGRRVENPAKGIYIMDGRKVSVK